MAIKIAASDKFYEHMNMIETVGESESSNF